MNVYIANFGRANALWDDCLGKSVIATFADRHLHLLWKAGDRDAYIERCIAGRTTAAGRTPTRAVASRWYNAGHLFASTEGDLWLHKNDNDLWWTVSEQGAMSESLETVPMPGIEEDVFVLRKPAAAWQRKDKRGRSLTWNGLHARARDFLVTESTVQKLKPENADYARALIEGDALSPWHNLEEWKAKEAAAGRSAARSVTLAELSAWQMVQQAIDTARAANGQQETRAVKVKEVTGFRDEHDFAKYVLTLYEAQEGRCALSDILLQHRGPDCDDQLRCSLDRIDSSGHYEPGNLQVVCHFINRWKSDMANDEFQRLLALVREEQ